MADRSRSSTFHKDGDGPQFNAIGEGTQNNNIGGYQFPRAVFNGDVNFGPRSSEPSLQERCLQALAFPEMESRSKDVDTATPGTCEWLLGNDEYKSWEQSSRGLLWIKGKPGSGKSTLLRHALNGIEADKGRDNAIVLSFFFHGRGVELQRTPLGLFRSLLHQLLSQAPVALPDLVDTFKKNDKERGKLDEKWTWHPGDLQGFFQSSIPKVLENRSVWLFVDALDESSNHTEMIKKLQSLLWGLPTSSQFHICFSCRHGLNLDKSGEFKICLEDENQEDISTYVRSQLSTSSTPPELRESEIPKIITEEACGLFIWARLAMEKVLELDGKGKGLREIEKEIRSIPPDLHDLYHKLVDQMSETEASLKLIRWICFANRSLSPDELRWALVIDATPPPQSLEECRSKDDWISNTDRMKKRVQALSRGLAEVITSSDTHVVQFIHQSVKDYFIDEGISILDQSSKPEAPTADMEGYAHYQLSRTCIRYLAMEEIGQSISRERDDMTSEFPFLHYAATSWVAHTKQSERRNVPQGDLLDYFGWPSEELVKRWVLIYQKLDRDSEDCPPEETSMIHPVSRYQLLGPLRMILKVGTGIDKRDGSGRTPLSWAAENGHEAIVKLLLATGKVDIDGKDNNGRTPLLWAAMKGHKAVVEFLYATGKVDVDGKDTQYGQTPLSWAAEQGHEAVVEFLYATGKVDVDTNDNYGQTPLSWAAENGHEAIVKLLLATGKVDVDEKDNGGRTPLLYAAWKGHEAVVKFLLATGKVDVDRKDNDGGTPLLWAAMQGHEAIVKLLLAMGKADIDGKDNDGRTPLLYAAMSGHEAVVKFLYATGKVDVDRKNNGRTPLLWAAMKGHEAVVKFLYATGKVDVDEKDNDGGTPLLWAAMNGHEAVVEFLYATGKVDVDGKDNNGRTPLLYAAWSGHEAVVKFLYATGKVDVDRKDNDGGTPLSWAAVSGHEAIVKLLLATGKVDIDGKDNNGRTPLLWAAMKGHEAVVEFLYATGKVDVDEKDNKGRTPLLWAAMKGHEAVVKFLYAMGTVDIDEKDNDGRTPLLYAAGNGHEAVVEFLYATGKVDVDEKDNDGGTPLLWAAMKGHEAVVKFLYATGKVDVDGKDTQYGRTALSLAAEQGHEAVVKFLYATGKVDIDGKNNKE